MSKTLTERFAVAQAREQFGRPEIDQLRYINAELLAALEELVTRCDGAEGVRADGSNIQTIRAHAAIEKAEQS